MADTAARLVRAVSRSGFDLAAGRTRLIRKGTTSMIPAAFEYHAPASIGEAISLAANQLLLHDRGRSKADGAKQVGSVHGDSVGLHASDAANAWRNIAAVSNPRNTAASIIVGAFHTAGQLHHQNKDPYPLAEQLDKVKAKDAKGLLKEAEGAIRDKDQFRSCAIATKYGSAGGEPRPVFDLLLRYAISEDGALHAEKYYRTVCEEFATTRPAFRWRQLVGLARVTASAYGYNREDKSGFHAPGYEEACKLLGVEV